MDKKEFGQFIKDKRKKLGLTMAELSAKSGVSHPYISQIENGHFKPSSDVLSKLAGPLRESPFNLLYHAGYLDDEQIIVNKEPLKPEDALTKLIEMSGNVIVNGEEVTNEEAKNLWESKRKAVEAEITYFLNRANITYNGHLLSDQDCDRILDMLKVLFPNYAKEEGE